MKRKNLLKVKMEYIYILFLYLFISLIFGSTEELINLYQILHLQLEMIE